jgi:cell division septal protein FtsQ
MKKPTRAISLIVVSLIFFGGGSYLFGWSGLLSVRSVSLIGAPTPESENAVRNEISISVGDKLARVDPRSLKARIRTFDWIESADISRNWISGKVSIRLQPRTPIALYSEPGKAQVALDASGMTFATPLEIKDQLPRVSANSVAGGLAAISLFTNLPEDFSKDIERMRAIRTDSFLIYSKISDRDLRIIWGDSKDLNLKTEVISALLKLPENKAIKMIDVSAPHAPVVK